MKDWKVEVVDQEPVTVQGDNVMDAVIEIVEKGIRMAEIAGVTQVGYVKYKSKTPDCPNCGAGRSDAFCDVCGEVPTKPLSQTLLEEKTAQFHDELDFGDRES